MSACSLKGVCARVCVNAQSMCAGPPWPVIKVANL